MVPAPTFCGVRNCCGEIKPVDTDDGSVRAQCSQKPYHEAYLTKCEDGHVMYEWVTRGKRSLKGTLVREGPASKTKPRLMLLNPGHDGLMFLQCLQAGEPIYNLVFLNLNNRTYNRHEPQ